MSEIAGPPDPPPSSPAAATTADDGAAITADDGAAITADDGAAASSSTSDDGTAAASRPTSPGTKRLLLTLTVFLSFLASLPFLLTSTNIHRSPLPFSSIAALSASLVRPPSSPSPLHVIFLPRSGNLDPRPLQHRLLQQNVTATVTVAVDTFDRSVFAGPDDEVDDALAKLVPEDVYSIVVVEGEEGRVVVGRHRHAWVVVTRGLEEEGAEMAAKVFADYFVRGGRGGGEDEFMPVGSDGSLVLSFSLLNAEPGDWVYDWDYQKIDTMLAHVVKDLAPVANISIESQVLYHTPKSSVSYRDDKLGAHIFSQNDLPFFVNSNEWHLDTSIDAGGRSKVLQFAVYVPSAEECPLLLRLPNGDISKSNGFTSPLWGGVVVWNPPNCFKESQKVNPSWRPIPNEDLEKIFQVFIGQLRTLFGFKSQYFGPAKVGAPSFLVSESGFTKWELDVLYRHYASYNLISSAATLESLSNLVQSLPRMIVMDEIGKQVKLSLDAATLAQKKASLGMSNASSVLSRNARALAEDAFFHPSLMSISYSSNEHYFAIYMPFFVPVLLHVLIAAIKELKRFKKERAKYLAFVADRAKVS